MNNIKYFSGMLLQQTYKIYESASMLPRNLILNFRSHPYDFRLGNVLIHPRFVENLVTEIKSSLGDRKAIKWACTYPIYVYKDKSLINSTNFSHLFISENIAVVELISNPDLS